MLARTTHNGTSTTGILRVMQYYGLPYRAGQRMKVNELRRGIDAGFPTLVTLQAYRETNRPYRELWDDGHWVVAIGYDKRRILFEDPSCLPPHLAGRRRATSSVGTTWTAASASGSGDAPFS